MKHILIIIFFVISSGICFGADVSGQKVPIEWNRCSVGDDCGAIEVGCWSWVIANKKYFDWVQKNMGSPVCTASSPPGPKPVSACIDQVCVDKWNACFQNSDCTAAAVKCTDSKVSNWKPVNKRFIKEIKVSERNYPEGRWAACPTSYDPGPGPEAQCVDRACKLIW